MAKCWIFQIQNLILLISFEKQQVWIIQNEKIDDFFNNDRESKICSHLGNFLEKMVWIPTLPVSSAEPIIIIKNEFLFILSLWIQDGDADYDDYTDMAPPPDPRAKEPFEQA